MKLFSIFRKGISIWRRSLCAFSRKYDVATPEDLYKALQTQIKKAGLSDNITTILNTWTTQSGYPVVHVSVNKDTVILKQERFFLEKNIPKNFADTLWHIPITWASIGNSSEHNNTAPKLWMTMKEARFKSNSLFTLNVKQSGNATRRDRAQL